MKPPMQNGVSPSVLHLEYLPNPPALLIEFLCQKFPHIDAHVWQNRFNSGQILGENHQPLPISTPYEHGTRIYYYRQLPTEVPVPFAHQVLFENDEFMVVDKPHFLTVSPAGNYVQQTLLTRLKAHSNNPKLSPIHRLDKDTAGLILISKNPATRHLYHDLFAKAQIDKVYHAIAERSCVPLPITLRVHLERGEPFYTMRVNLHKTANSQTTIRALDTQGDWTKYELIPTTGKLHQLRVHMYHLGMPIKNDAFYPSVCHQQATDFSKPLQLLAKKLAFIDPVSRQYHEFYSDRRLVF